MRVLMADTLAATATARLVAGGHEVRADGSLEGASLVEAIRAWKPDVLVVRSTRVEAAHFEASSGLALVIRAGAGVNTIDLEAAGAAGSFVANCPGRNGAAVAELAVGLMIALDRRIPDAVAAFRGGRWEKGAFSKGAGLKGKTVGILGTGRIGLGVARRARSFKMNVVAWSRSLTDNQAAEHGVVRCESALEVARRSDILSIHLALAPGTRGIVSAELLDALPDGATVINTSRGGLCDEDALAEALDRKGLWLGLDVLADEPTGKSAALVHRFADHPRVYVTPHIGASTTEAQQSVAGEACRLIEVFDATGRAENCVNLVTQTQADSCLVVRHRDRVGALAAVFALLREAGLNVQEMENTIFRGGQAAVARIQVNGVPDAAAIAAVASAPDVLHVSLVPIHRGAAR